jgi:trk system potassium uptake protein TrkA
MSIFKREKKENVIIVGCGRFGSSLATLLSEQNKNVTIIDMDENALIKLPPSYIGGTIEGDGTDIDLLELSGAKNTDTLIASTNDDVTNIMIAQIAKQVFQIKNVITTLYDLSKQSAYSNMDIITICPSILSVNEFKRMTLVKEKDEA